MYTYIYIYTYNIFSGHLFGILQYFLTQDLFSSQFLFNTNHKDMYMDYETHQESW